MYIYFRWSYNCVDLFDAIGGEEDDDDLVAINNVHLDYVRIYKKDAAEDVYVDAVSLFIGRSFLRHTRLVPQEVLLIGRYRGGGRGGGA